MVAPPPPRTLCHSASAASPFIVIFVSPFAMFFHLFFPFLLTSFLRPSVPVLFGSVVSSLTHQLDMGTARFFFVVSVGSLSLPSSCLLVFLPSVWSGLLVASLCWSFSWTDHTPERTSKQRPCPRDSACASRACSLRFSFCHLSLPLNFFLSSSLFVFL